MDYLSPFLDSFELQKLSNINNFSYFYAYWIRECLDLIARGCGYNKFTNTSKTPIKLGKFKWISI
jgi:hypothetical protein